MASVTDAAPEPVVNGETLVVDNNQPVPYDLSPEKMLTDTLMFVGLLFGIFYFLLIRPQQKRVKAHQRMLERLQKGAKVVTTGGLIGTVIKLEGTDIVMVEIAQGVKVRVARSGIHDVDPGFNTTAPATDTANDN